MSEKEKLPVGSPHLRVMLIDNDSNRIPEVLGITEEREEELDAIIKKYVEDKGTITDSIEAISRYVKHANEFAYCMFHVGANVGRSVTLRDTIKGDLSSLLDRLSRGGDDSPKSED